ncbi:hypothetical protein EMPS_08648 [Entomortierella parvispora]|uniref:MARVEL domain-containing protein n=1 Tax=Entomortierella parvispora TaxID=205924 RepID=A0A9P3HGH4_9FUNG|nr:hypothetical protein EMPS_08648 [Entomortierella parvispora]
MNLSPTSRTLFLVQLGSFFSGLIVVVCCCLYLSAYPKSPDNGSISAIACATLVFALISTLTTLVLVFRQKSGRTINATIEGCWVGFALLVWILAAVGGIAKPANNMTNVSCKVLPSTGKDTNDKNFMRACQSMFASTAFCIISALFFMATAGILITFSVQKAVRDKKASQVKVGGTYQLGPSPSEYRRAEENGELPGSEEPKNAEDSPPISHPTATGPGTSLLSPATTMGATTGGRFSDNVYQDPSLTTGAPIVATPPAVAVPHSGGVSPYNTYQGSGGHIPQASYPSPAGGVGPSGYNYGSHHGNTSSYNNQGYLPQPGAGHVQQGSAMSNMSASAYDGYQTYDSSNNPYGHQTYPQQQQPVGGTYPMMMGPPHQQSPYGNQYQSQSGPTPSTLVMAMPRPEHFS